jgi:hypothetical protein
MLDDGNQHREYCQWAKENPGGRGRYLNLSVATREGVEKHRAIVHVTVCE